MSRKITNKKTLWFILKLLLTIGSLAWCVHLVDYNKVGQLVSNADHGVLIWLIPLVIVHTASGALRFKVLVDPHCPLPYFQHLRQYFIANYFNLILPSSIGGDAVRVFMLGNQGVSKSKAAAYIFSERLMGLYSLILIAVSAGFTVAVSDNIVILALSLAGLSVLSLGGIYLVMLFTRGIEQYHVAAAREAIKELWAHKLRLFGAVSLSLIYQLFTISFTALIAIAFGFDVSLLLLLALVPLVWLVTFLPISIGGVGVRELSFVGLFSQAGLDSEQAIFLSLGTYAAMLLAGAMGGLWALRDSFRFTPGKVPPQG